ncbi:MAG: hypothetical protein IKZ86_02425 [Spirochaetaceae bacterium]|nr:hypothetical protein [Spirochaetaceae bacterium]
MKVKFVPLLICLGIAALAGYGFYAANGGEDGNTLMFAVAGVGFFIMLGCGFGIKYAERGSGNITVLSVLALIVNLVVNVIFTFVQFKTAPYIIISGILLLIYIGLVYALAKALN